LTSLGRRIFHQGSGPGVVGPKDVGPTSSFSPFPFGAIYMIVDLSVRQQIIVKKSAQ